MLDALTKKQISKFILEYLQKRIPNFKKKGDIFTCPFGHKHPDNIMSAHLTSLTSGKVHCYDPGCGELGDIFSLCRKIDFNGQEDLEDEDIADFLIQELGIRTDNKIHEWLEKYQKWGWSLVPVEANSKRANIESEWQKKIHKSIEEWRDWLESGINVGLNCGEVSNTTLIDIDSKEIPEELKKFVGETLTQNTNKGYHLVYLYDADLPSIDLRDTSCKLPIEIRSSGGFQTVIYPSIVEGKERTWNDKEPIKIPEELKKWLLEKIVVKDSPKEVLKAPTESLLEDLKIQGLEGKCNSSFVKFGGLLRKQLNMPQTEYVLDIVNSLLLDEPMPKKDIRMMMKELGKYAGADVNVLTKQISEYLLRHEEASARDLVECLKAERKDIQEVLAQLIQENKIYKQKNLYKIINKPVWKTEFMSESQVLGFDIPFFSPYATFRRGDMICLGASTGIGKSYLALNFIKSFVDQGLKPNYISSEPGNRFATIAMKLGLKEGQFSFCNHYEPQKLELEDEAITIVDWLLPDEYFAVDKLYKIFAKQLDQHGGLLYIFSQLKDNGDFYSKEMVRFFASFAVKYFYTNVNGVIDPTKTYFKTEKIREAKGNSQYVVIPTAFNNPYLELRKT